MSAPFGIVLTNWSAIGAIAAIAAAAIGLTSLAIVLADRFKARPKATIRELYVGWSERAAAGCTGLVRLVNMVKLAFLYRFICDARPLRCWHGEV